MGSVQIFFGSEKRNNKRGARKRQPIENTESGGAVNWNVDSFSKGNRDRIENGLKGNEKVMMSEDNT